MPIFYPSIETIKKFKVPPTEGERTLLNFLYRTLDDSFEVYFNPYLNGDRPDILIMRKGYGVMVIEVKDWNLENFCLNERKKWIYKPNGSVVKSPIDQVLKYKENLYDLHVPELLEMKIKDIYKFQVVSCAVYFHCANQSELEEMVVNPYKADRKYMNFLKYNIDFIGYDGLNESSFEKLLAKRYLLAGRPSRLFTDKIYDNFQRILSPAIHLKTQGNSYSYSQKQKDIIYSTTLEQRVKGDFGSGKTTVLAARAVQAYKRALSRTNYPRILILTYNVTLKNFIYDKLNRVNEVFPIGNFIIIINYHQFINHELNNLGIEIELPAACKECRLKSKRVGENKKLQCNKCHVVDIAEYFEREYYGNVILFDNHKDEIVKYDAVLIDEIQDYHRNWMEIIKNYFRDPDGDYVLFGDVKQNIYGGPTENKDVSTNVNGRPTELKDCLRSNFKVRDLAQSFQKNIFAEKYEVDDFSENGTYSFLGHTTEKDCYINYMYLDGHSPIVSLYNIVRGNILNKEIHMSPNDITILGCTTDLLRVFDSYYRYASREKTKTMMETVETMYLVHLNYIKTEDNAPDSNWFNNITRHLGTKLFPQRKKLLYNDFVLIKQRIAILFTIYDLYVDFGDTFSGRLNEECNKNGISLRAFLAFREHYRGSLDEFKKRVYEGDYKVICDNKKLHFWMNSGTIKISTIHSFKGWESEVIFLIVEPNSKNEYFDELIYTGITRAKKDLVVINLGDKEYDNKIRPIIDVFR